MSNLSRVQELQQGIIWLKVPLVLMLRKFDINNENSSKNFKKMRADDRTRVVFK